MSFHPAKCPNCGGDLQLPTDRASVKCMYCGGEVMVQQAIQAFAAGSISSWMQLAKEAATAGNNQEAVVYFNKVLEADPTTYEAWLSKGVCTGWMGTLVNPRLGEMLTHIRHAVECAPDGEKAAIKKRAAHSTNEVAIAFYNLAWGHMLKFVTVPDIWSGYLVHSGMARDALAFALSLDPNNAQAMKNIVQICANDISGIEFMGNDKYGNSLKMAHLVTDAYSEKLSARMQEIVPRIRTLEPNYSPPVIKKAKPGACFIATAVAGDYSDPSVTLLERFRDEFLLGSMVGRTFVRAYYRVSPRAAVLLKRSAELRRLALRFAVKPATVVARFVLRRYGADGAGSHHGIDLLP